MPLGKGSPCLTSRRGARFLGGSWSGPEMKSFFLLRGHFYSPQRSGGHGADSSVLVVLQQTKEPCLTQLRPDSPPFKAGTAMRPTCLA